MCDVSFEARDQVCGDNINYKCLTIALPRNAFVTLFISSESQL